MCSRWSQDYYPNNKFFCDICCRGKLPYYAVNKKPDDRALKPLDLVHSDLAGPISPVAKDGFEYYKLQLHCVKKSSTKRFLIHVKTLAEY